MTASFRFADADDIQPDHVAEAIHYRRLDRQL
jgi:hypothetical protein